MTRLAEDKIWANDIATAEAVLTFVVMLTEGREDAVDLRKSKITELRLVDLWTVLTFALLFNDFSCDQKVIVPKQAWF